MKLTKRISLLMAIIMVVTTIMSVMPVTVIAADADVADQVSIYKADANGNKGAVIQQSKKWADVKASITGATEDIVVVLEGNLAHSAATTFTTTKKVYIDGQDKYTIANTVANGFVTSDDTSVRNVTFRNVKITDNNVGCFFQWKCQGTLTFDNVDLTATGNVNWAVINMNNTKANTTSTLNIVNGCDFKVVTTANRTDGAKFSSGIIRGGNGGTGVKGIINITDSTINATGGRHRAALWAHAHNTYNITNSVIASAGVHAIYKAGNATLNIDNKTVVSSGAPLADFGTTGSSSCSATVWVNGVQQGSAYTAWKDAVAAANAALANGNVELRVSGNAVINYGMGTSGSASNGGFLGAAGGNKLTITGATGNDSIIISAAHHAFYPTGIVEFKNIAIYSNATSIVNNNGSNNNVGEQLIFDNVDIYLNTASHTNHVLAYMETNLGAANNPFKLDIINGTTVQLMDYVTGTIGKGFVWCDYRGNHYVDITVADSEIDLSAGKASAFYLEWNNSSAETKVGLINMTVTNSEIVTKGANAIQGTDQIKSFKMDLDSSIAGLSIGTDCGAMNNGAKVQLIGSETPSITVNGTNYTSFKAAMAAAMTATDDVTITLNSNVVVGEQINIKQANGKKITVDGQGKYTILTIGVNNVMCPAADSTGAVEFKNLSVYSNSTGSFCQIYAPVDVTFENVDILVSRNQRYCLVNSIYDNCITPVKVIFRNVNVTGEGLTGQNNAGVNVYRSGNEGFDNFINLIVDNCNFDLSGENVGGIMILKGTTANVFIKDSYIYGSSTDSINSKPVYVSGSVNSVLGDQMLPEGFKANTTTCTFVNSEFDGENYIAENLTSKAYTASQVAPATQNGAEVRLKDPTGLRFITDISNTVIANVESFADADSVKFGTLIVPAKFLSGYAFDEYIEEFLAEGNGALILDIPATEVGTEVTANGVTLRAAVVGLEGMYKEQLTAMAYIEFTVQGETFRIYGNSTDKRSVEGVATDALADKSATADDEYKYLVNEGEYGVVGQYSPYTKEQRDILAKYAGLK